jgi:hypothetical protein
LVNGVVLSLLVNGNNLKSLVAILLLPPDQVGRGGNSRLSEERSEDNEYGLAHWPVKARSITSAQPVLFSSFKNRNRLAQVGVVGTLGVRVLLESK